MVIGRFGYLPLPFYNTGDGAGSGAPTGGAPTGGSPSGGNAPLGAEPVKQSQASSGVAPGGNEPQVYELDENALIKVKGSDKPVKFGEYGRNFQAQWTKANQRAAQLERQLREYQEKVKQSEQARQGTPGQQADPRADLFQKLESLPYLDGKTARSVIEGIGDEIRQRDRVLLGALKELQQTQKLVKELYGNHTNSAFEGKLQRWIKEGGYPDDALDLAREVYLAYEEGPELDEQFPQIFAERWKQLEKAVEAKRLAQIRANRPAPFVPGKGGQAGPSKPLEIKPGDSRSRAEQLWALYGGGRGEQDT